MQVIAIMRSGFVLAVCGVREEEEGSGMRSEGKVGKEGEEWDVWAKKEMGQNVKWNHAQRVKSKTEGNTSRNVARAGMEAMTYHVAVSHGGHGHDGPVECSDIDRKHRSVVQLVNCRGRRE